MQCVHASGAACSEEKDTWTEAAAHARAGGPAEFVITPFDAHGNAGASGGRFAAELVQEASAGQPAEPSSPRTLECAVTESSTGAAAFLFTSLSPCKTESLCTLNQFYVPYGNCYMRPPCIFVNASLSMHHGTATR